MTSIPLPIFGLGSQPPEQDGATLDYLQMPQEMATYAMPQISVDLNSVDWAQVKKVLQQLQHDLAIFPAQSKPSRLIKFDAENRRFIDELLGEGEVGAMCSGEQDIRIQESVMAGVWRSQTLNAQRQIVDDVLEVGIIPQQLPQRAFAEAASQIDTYWTELPSGVMNAPPLLAELNAKIARYQPGDEAHTINLSLLPQTEQDLAFLAQRLGTGNVTILSRGYGTNRITATGIKYVWWVQYFNSQDTLILNTLEVSDVPSVACASPEDIADSCQRLQEILKVYL
ncbi:MAG: hydrogenase expression/formation protein [Methylovulum sp.]|uniref:hydrogenase expression/formation protein n=1 Tax=Methylovulum sp. TaxID=1916980 RepID=UPI002614F091|nr:hydrogenase expression/formation protein [Methylovulum sp.]MDD2724420.1 hydrogenase expression/formation protein [Methylovulum sp.]MDD5123995.1 hydrogenase expression/formation protein [Methylovulum sp.]